MKSLTYFVTYRCNFKCAHCFVHKESWELTVPRLQKFVEGLPWLYRVSLSGGEPFIRKDLADICIAFASRTNVITIPTNGSLDVAETITKTMSNRPKLNLHISLSLDGLGVERDMITGSKNSMVSFIRTMYTIKKLKEHHDNLFLGVIVTQTPLNEHKLDEIYDAVMTYGVDNFGFNIARGSRGITHCDLEIYRKLSKKVAKTKVNFPLGWILKNKKKLLFERTYQAYKHHRFISPCYSGDKRIVIDPSGNIYPCEHMMFEGKMLLGNIDHYEPIRTKGCFCGHECDNETNILLNPRYWPRLLV